MPIYDYKCTVCGVVHDELRKIDDRDNPTYCELCNNQSDRIPTSPAGINGGCNEFYRHRSGKKAVWQSDMGPQGKIGKEWYGDNPHAPSTLDKKIK